MKTLQNLKSKKGFTLVELLVVIAILAVLAVAVVVVLNPAELLKQARDSTRISDLAAINSAIALYFADVAPSSMTASSTCTTGTTFPGGSTCVNKSCNGLTCTCLVANKFTNNTTCSPLPPLPLDPINTGSLYYAAKVSSTVGAYEINANMESIKYSSTTASEVVSATKDGGNVAGWYEVGSSLAQTW